MFLLFFFYFGIYNIEITLSIDGYYVDVLTTNYAAWENTLQVPVFGASVLFPDTKR